jgi:uncharacterized membrane protein
MNAELTSTRSVVRTARGWWGLVLAGGLLGVIGTVWQTVERIGFESGTDGSAVCDINAVISCGSTYSFWQSSALGVPNSLIGLPVFAIMTSGALAALLGSRLSSRYIATLLGLSVFMTAFVFWYMEQTAFVMGALCLFCTASMINIMLVGTGLTRVAAAEGALGDGKAGQRLRLLVDAKADLMIWFGIALIVGVMLFVGLVL